MANPEAVAIIGAAVAVPVVIAPVAIIGGILHSVRKMEHAERLAALQRGMTLPKDEPWLNPVKVVFLMTTVAPTAIFGILTIGLANNLGDDLIAGAIPLALGCIIGGVILGMRLPAFRTPQPQPFSPDPTTNHTPASTAKPNFNPESFDFAGRN